MSKSDKTVPDSNREKGAQAPFLLNKMDVKKQLILQGIDPSLLTEKELLDIEKVHLDPKAQAALEEHLKEWIDDLSRLSTVISDHIIRLAALPETPQGGEKFASSCAKILANISRAKERFLAEDIPLLRTLIDRWENDHQTALVLQKEAVSQTISQQESGKNGQNCPILDISSPFWKESKEKVTALSEIISETDIFLGDFALRVARLGKKVDQNIAKNTDYEKEIEMARIRLHDLALRAMHIGKECQDVKIHTCP